MLRPLLSQAAHLIWPARCAGCDAFVPAHQAFCRTCSGSLLPLDQTCPGCALPSPLESLFHRRCLPCSLHPPPFARARALVAYGGAMTPALLRLKHAGALPIARALGGCLAPLLRIESQDIDLVLPVPLHPRRLRARGFNQALEILRAARASGGKQAMRPRLLVDMLRRVRDTPSLGHHSPLVRRSLLQAAFSVVDPDWIRGQRILIVDDVMTTGATLAGCAETLLDSGASQVNVLVVARALSSRVAETATDIKTGNNA